MACARRLLSVQSVSATLDSRVFSIYLSPATTCSDQVLHPGEQYQFFSEWTSQLLGPLPASLFTNELTDAIWPFFVAIRFAKSVSPLSGSSGSQPRVRTPRQQAAAGDHRLVWSLTVSLWRNHKHQACMPCGQKWNSIFLIPQLNAAWWESLVSATIMSGYSTIISLRSFLWTSSASQG